MASPRTLLLFCLVGRTILGSRVRVSDVTSRKRIAAQLGKMKLSNKCSEWPGPNGTSREAFMAHMAIGIYWDVRKNQVGDWNLELVGDTTGGQDKSLGGRDYFGIYRKGQECVLTLAGSSNAQDWANNIQFVHYDMPYCGISDIHYGFFNQWSDTIWSNIWNDEFIPFFDVNCTDGISVVGHSLGGAVASVMATCVHSTAPDGPLHDASSDKMTRPINIPWLDPNNEKRVNQTRLPIISELWTFGAPGVAQTQVTNQSAEDAILKGKRFFIEDYWVFDPVPFSGHLTGLQHPKMTAVRLYQDGDNCTEEHWGPEDDDAAWAPNTMKIPDAQKHTYSYEPRVVDAFG